MWANFLFLCETISQLGYEPVTTIIIIFLKHSQEEKMIFSFFFATKKYHLQFFSVANDKNK